MTAPFTRNTFALASLGVVAFAFAVPIVAQAADAEAVFVRGEVQVLQVDGARRALAAGGLVRPGESLQAGADGYAHLRFPDGGFVGLRPGARFAVEDYATDATATGGVRVRYRLDAGSVRAITGQTVEQNKSRFRLNTPVAAVGVRGTDYVVQATEKLTRATVNVGAIVMAPLGVGCDAASLGICETAAARTLSAGMGAAYIEYRAGAQAPEIKKMSAPVLVPATPDEPTGAQGKRSESGSGGATANGSGTASGGAVVGAAASPSSADTSVTATASRVESVVAALAPPQEVVWGRWSSVAAGTTTVVEQIDKGYRPWSLSPMFALLVRELPGDMPQQGVVGFDLVGSEAYVRDASGGSTAASVRDGSLTVDFGARQFQTQLSVDARGANQALAAAGRVDWQGNLIGDASRSTMNVLGVLGGAKAGDAGYLFDKVLDAGAVLYGATNWRR